MDLLGYIKSKDLIPEEVLTEVINSHIVKKFTLFQELYTNGEHYGINQKELLNWVVDAGGPGYLIVDTTKGLSTDHEDYMKLGGVESCMNLKIMCVRKNEEPLCIVTIRPDDVGLVVMLNKAFGPGSYSFGVCTSDIWDAIYQLDVEPLFIEARAVKLNNQTMHVSSAQTAVRDSEARAIYNHILMLGISRGASDIHLIPCDRNCQVLYRIDGTNYNLMSIPLQIADRVANLLIADGNVGNKGPDVPLDGKIRYHPPGSKVDKDARDLRFSVMPTRRGKDVNIRFLNNVLYTFEGLGMTPDNVAKYKKILNMPQGLVMQVGPTGSGKSTTLYAGLNYIHQNSLRNIITVEDPVEILMEGITQVDVKEETNLTFARVSRQFLRHDVDVGVVGEIRDEETALEAVRAATTGHLVISSLHTNDSLGVIERLIKLGVDSYTLSEVLVAVMGQRLLRRVCPRCAETYEVPLEEKNVYDILGVKDRTKPLRLKKAVGCEHCNNLGYKGRIAVNEILLVDRVLRDMIQRHETRKAMEDHLEQEHFITMYKDACEKVLSGVTTLEELQPMYMDTLAYK